VTVSATELGAIIEAVARGLISRAQGREVLDAHATSGDAAAAIIAARGFRQISDSGSVAAAVEDVLAANPAAVADFHAGKAQAVGFLVGQVMKATSGQANPALVQAAVRERLEAGRQEGG
jgi:aspartyl-tRNA(Asn)/glutamyl-tRNA(Gln) amidotransferase subunit B